MTLEPSLCRLLYWNPFSSILSGHPPAGRRTDSLNVEFGQRRHIYAEISHLWSLRTFYTDLSPLIGYSRDQALYVTWMWLCCGDPRNGESDRWPMSLRRWLWKLSCNFVRLPLQILAHVRDCLLVSRNKLILRNVLLHVCEQRVFHSDQHFQSSGLLVTVRTSVLVSFSMDNRLLRKLIRLWTISVQPIGTVGYIAQR